MPANILFHSFKFVIGYSSSVLFEAANEGCISISLLNYFKPEEEERKKNYILYLTKNLEEEKKIYFPTSIQEINKIISTNSKC